MISRSLADSGATITETRSAWPSFERRGRRRARRRADQDQAPASSRAQLDRGLDRLRLTGVNQGPGRASSGRPRASISSSRSRRRSRWRGPARATTSSPRGRTTAQLGGRRARRRRSRRRRSHPAADPGSTSATTNSSAGCRRAARPAPAFERSSRCVSAAPPSLQVARTCRRRVEPVPDRSRSVGPSPALPQPRDRVGDRPVVAGARNSSRPSPSPRCPGPGPPDRSGSP